MSCEVSDNCANNTKSCWHCQFDIVYGGLDNCYSAIDKNIKHPQVLARKEEHKKWKKEQKLKDQRDKEKWRITLLKQAAKAEERVKKTLNSGRINRDGDLKTRDLMIDVKLQTTRINPEINKEEFDKCQCDALRAGKDHGVLAITNKIGDTYYVIPEAMFREIIGE